MKYNHILSKHIKFDVSKYYENNVSHGENYSGYKYRAKQRNLPFELTYNDYNSLLDNSICYLCGYSSNLGLDRLNSDLGYNIQNVKPCCTVCNRLKSNFPLEHFLNHLKLIINENIPKIVPTNFTVNDIEKKHYNKMSRLEKFK